MKKLCKLWSDNKVLIVLMIVLLVCFVIILSVSVTYFYGSNDENYTRLKGNDKVKVNDTFKNKLNTIKEEYKEINSVSVYTNNKSKTLYLKIVFNNDININDAKEVTSNYVKKIDEDYLKYYDFNITISGPGGEKTEEFLTEGAHNQGGSGYIVWNNIATLEEEEN